MDKSRKNTVLSIVVFLGITLFYLFTAQNDVKNVERAERIIWSDVQIYYSYLPATFIENDPFFEHKEQYDTLNKYWTLKSPTGKNLPKTTMGVALLEAPFFFIGHQYAKQSPKYAANGFSAPYGRAISFGTAFYGIVGLLFLFLFLKTRFTVVQSLLSVISIGIGTNLFFYSVYESGMSHPFTFFIFSALLFFTQIWFKKKGFVLSFVIGGLLGLIVLIRPINILFLLPMLFFYKQSDESWESYLNRLIFPLFPLVLIVIGGIFIWLPQMLFWKMQSGQFFYFSYPGESFFWLNSHVMDGLFSFRKGWFIYTPMMLLSLIGLIRLFHTHRNLFLGLAWFLPLFLYITFSWWAWWYGGGFSARTLVDILPIMAIPLAAFYEWILPTKLRYVILIIPVFFVQLNIYQSWQYRQGIIHYDGMTYEAYKSVFFKHYTPNGYWDQLQQPDYEQARLYGE